LNRSSARGAASVSRFARKMRLHSSPFIHIKSALRDVFDVVLPPYCGVCDLLLEPNEKVVCESCFQAIRFQDSSFCWVCGRPLKKKASRCEKCEEYPLTLSRVRSLGLYDDNLATIIHLLKYQQKPSLARRLGRMMSVVVLRDPVLSRAELVMPVPLHPVRRRERGYNQSELLSKSLANSAGFPLVTKALIRGRNTRSQTDLSPEERFRNVNGAFCVRHPDTVDDKIVLLVDDVMTTGYTLDSCAQVLLDAGTNKVCGITCAVV
jgi:competence protein ComFC